MVYLLRVLLMSICKCNSACVVISQKIITALLDGAIDATGAGLSIDPVEPMFRRLVGCIFITCLVRCSV